MVNILVRIFIFFGFISVSTTLYAVDNSTQEQKFQPYNYLMAKSGAVLPTPLNGNTGLNTGNNTYTAGLAIGRQLLDVFSIDLEYMHRANNTTQFYAPGYMATTPTTWSMKSNTILMNLKLNLMPDHRVSPYIIAGGGLAINKSSNYSLVDAETDTINTYPGKTVKNFAWQTGCGINFKINSMFSSQIEYSYVDRGSIKTQSMVIYDDGTATDATAIKGNFIDNVITFGIKVKF